DRGAGREADRGGPGRLRPQRRTVRPARRRPDHPLTRPHPGEGSMPARTTTTARRTALLSLSSALALGLSIGLVGCSSTDESRESSGAGAESAQSPAPTTVTQAPTPGSGDVLITVEHGADAEAKIITHDSGQPLQQILEGAGSWEAILPA